GQAVAQIALADPDLDVQVRTRLRAAVPDAADHRALLDDRADREELDALKVRVQGHHPVAVIDPDLPATKLVQDGLGRVPELEPGVLPRELFVHATLGVVRVDPDDRARLRR